MTHGKPENSPGGEVMGNAQNDSVAVPGVSAEAMASAASDALMPPKLNSRSGRRPYASVATSATRPPRRLGTPTAVVSRPGSVSPASCKTEDAK